MRRRKAIAADLKKRKEKELAEAEERKAKKRARKQRKDLLTSTMKQHSLDLPRLRWAADKLGFYDVRYAESTDITKDIIEWLTDSTLLMETILSTLEEAKSVDASHFDRRRRAAGGGARVPVSEGDSNQDPSVLAVKFKKVVCAKMNKLTSKEQYRQVAEALYAVHRLSNDEMAELEKYNAPTLKAFIISVLKDSDNDILQVASETVDYLRARVGGEDTRQVVVATA